MSTISEIQIFNQRLCNLAKERYAALGRGYRKSPCRA